MYNFLVQNFMASLTNKKLFVRSLDLSFIFYIFLQYVDYGKREYSARLVCLLSRKYDRDHSLLIHEHVIQK